MGGAEVKCRFHLRGIETLQPRDEHQHAIGRDEGCLAEHRQENPVAKKPVIGKAEHAVEPAPEHQGGDAEHHARDQDRGDDDGVVGGAQLRPDLGQDQGAGKPEEEGQDNSATPDDGAVFEAADDALVVIEGVEPLEGEALEGSGARKARRVEGGDPHDQQRAEQIAEENDEVDDKRHLQKRRRAAPGAHLPISPILTLKRRITARTKMMQVIRRTTA